MGSIGAMTRWGMQYVTDSVMWDGYTLTMEGVCYCAPEAKREWETYPEPINIFAVDTSWSLPVNA